MTITGKTVFKVVYLVNLLVQAVFIGYQLLVKSDFSQSYLTVASLSVISTSLGMLAIMKNKG